jgi:hypothetical protein
MRNGFQASPVMAMTGTQFLEEGPEVAGVAAIDLNPSRLQEAFAEDRQFTTCECLRRYT